jgi:hypothetical protein
VGGQRNSLPDLTGSAEVAPEMSQREELTDPSFFFIPKKTFYVPEKVKELT